MDICGLTPIAKADDEPAAFILPPQTLEKLTDAKAEEDAKLKAAFDSGSIGDLNGFKQLQTLAKQNGIAIARTEADFIKLLDVAEPGIPHGDLGGEAFRSATSPATPTAFSFRSSPSGQTVIRSTSVWTMCCFSVGNSTSQNSSGEPKASATSCSVMLL